jgi:hypothetical protein
MITVLNTYPSHYQEDLPIDIALEIEFSKELKDEFLTSQYFRIFVLPDYVGVVTAEITKDTTNPKKVIITPSVDFPINTQLEVFVAGDMNTADVTLQGVQSRDLDVMDKNYTFRFTTGSTREVDVIPEVGDVDDGDTTDTIIIGEDGELIDISDHLAAITSVDPPDEAYSVDCSGYPNQRNYIDLYFDSPVILNSNLDQNLEIRTTTLNDLETYIDHTAIHGKVLTGADITIDYHPDYLVSGHNVLRLTLDDAFQCNSDITVSVDNDFVIVSGAPSTVYKLDKDYEFEFRTILFPMLTTARAVRSALKHSISNLSNKVIDEYIFMVSIDILETYFNGQVTEAILNNYWVRKLATCMTVKALSNSVLGGHIGIVRERTLGDLKIVYNTTALMEITAAVDDCVYEAESHLNTDDGHTATGVKSGLTARYPHRRRHVFDV